MIDDDRLRDDHRPRRADDRAGDRVTVDQHRPGYAVLGPHRVRRPVPACGPWPVGLVQRGGRVHGLGRYRGEPYPGDAAGVPVHGYGQLGLHPPQRHRIEREHVQPRRVYQHVLTWPGWPQFPVNLRGPVCDVAVPFRAQPERRMVPFQLGQNSERCGAAGDLNHVFPEPGRQSGVGAVDHHRARRPGLLRVLGHHLQGGLRPPVIHSAQRLDVPCAGAGQSGLGP